MGGRQLIEREFLGAVLAPFIMAALYRMGIPNDLIMTGMGPMTVFIGGKLYQKAKVGSAALVPDAPVVTVVTSPQPAKKD